MSRNGTLLAAVLLCAATTARGDDPGLAIKRLAHATTWVGNSFGGDGGPNGAGYWVQNGVDEIDVTPDGTVFAGISWDEAGRCAGLYKDGRPNRVLLKEHDGKGKETAWGFGTANNALAASGNDLYIANLGKKLLRFRWTPGDVESARFVDEVDLPAEAVGLAARGDRLVVVFADHLELRATSDLAPTARIPLIGALDAAISPKGDLWVLAAGSVHRVARREKKEEQAIPGLEKPTAIAFDNEGRLLVCDDGRRQQVLTFDVAAAPRLVTAFGAEGGLLAGIPGVVRPTKLFALRGAGTDAAGNLYVAMGYAGTPSGNCVIRSFDVRGALRWQVFSTAFVDTFGFDPSADGAVVYGRTTVFDLDLSQTKPSATTALRALTLDHLRHPDDDRIKYGCSVVVRRLEGKRLLYMIGQYGGGYRFYSFDEPAGMIARQVGQIHPDGETWAWDVDDEGAVWHGDAPNRTIRRHRFRGWSPSGAPQFGVDKLEIWPWPADFELVRRVIYEKTTDSLYLFGYLKGQAIDSWGVVGRTVRRIDGWLNGRKTVRYSAVLPTNPHGSDKGGPLSPQGVDVAGDYLFVGMVKADEGVQYTHVLSLADGRYVGSLGPGPEVGGNAGWQDMPYPIQALKRKNGEYLVLVEEDWRGKNLLYRWRPEPAW